MTCTSCWHTFLICILITGSSVVSTNAENQNLGRPERSSFIDANAPRNPSSFRQAANPSLSCQLRCGVNGVHNNIDCQCNAECVEREDCCADFEAVCKSCRGRCFSKYAPTAPCQCNSQCERHSNCCPDYDKCKKAGVTSAELAILSEELLSLDENNAADLIEVRLQGKTRAGGPDNAPSPLLLLQKGIFDNETSTLSLLVRMHDNYEAGVGIPEVVTDEDIQEETEFLDAIMSTPIMKRTEAFLTREKNLIPGNATFRQAFEEIWFGLYSRAGNVLGSSGFEHVFLGELKKGVSGFHNWAYFAREERSEDLNYKGYMAYRSLGDKGLIISHTFEWRGHRKPISSMWIGTSPELELALYTVCFYVRPRGNGLCPIALNGSKLQIQTHVISRNGKNYVGAAYPVI